MSSITISINSRSDTTPNVRNVRKWIVPEDGQAATTVSSFMQLPFWTEKNGFNAINTFQPLCPIGGTEEQYLYDLQKQYEGDGYGFTAAQKTAWLINKDGGVANSPYWYKDGWLVYGSCLMSGNVIEVESDGGKPVEYVFNGRYRTEPYSANHPIAFYRVLGLRRSELTAGYRHETQPTKIHNIGVAYAPNSVYIDHTPKGFIASPVWDARDYPCAAGELYFAKAYLEQL